MARASGAMAAYRFVKLQITYAPSIARPLASGAAQCAIARHYERSFLASINFRAPPEQKGIWRIAPAFGVELAHGEIQREV